MARSLTTWADLSNALFDPIEGLVARSFPTIQERKKFRKTHIYDRLHALVEKKMEATGVVAGATPKKSGKFVVRLPRSLHGALEREAEAEGTRATLLAEAEGRAKLAKATAAEGEINLRQFVIETLAKADVEKTAFIAEALAGVGENVKIVQFAGQNGASPTGVTLLDMLMNVPEMATVLSAKVEALTGEGMESQVMRALQMLAEIKLPSGENGAPAEVIDEAGGDGQAPAEEA